MGRKKKKVILIEHLVNELKTSQSGTRQNSCPGHGTQPEKPIWTNVKNDIHCDKVLGRRAQNNTSAGIMKRNLSESNNSIRARPSEKSSSKHGANDFKVRHTYSNDFKNRGHSKNYVSNIKGSPKPLLSLQFPDYLKLGNCPNSASGTTHSSTIICQETNLGKNQASGIKSSGNSSKGNEFNLGKPSIRPTSTPKGPAQMTSASGFSNFKNNNETLDLKPKSKAVTPIFKKYYFKRKYLEQTPGPSGQSDMSDVVVINEIRANEKFDIVNNLIGKGNPNVNKSLINKKESNGLEDEEMDWEPSDQIVMIEHIKSIRKNLDTATSLSCELALNANNFIERLKDNVLLVLDTNIFISCLPFVRDIRDSYLPELGLPIVFIPWVVLRELDHLKGSGADQLARSAVRAIRYINETLSLNHPRVIGQSFEDFCSMKNAGCGSTDDEILSTCINIKAVDDRRRVILITNDKNLESKAMLSRMEAHSKEKFVECVINKNKHFGNESDHNLVAEKYTLYPKLKSIMKIALEMVVEYELKKAFGDDWLRLVIRKPPWNLVHVFECFLKHWRSVFTFIFKKDLESDIRDIKKRFSTEDRGKGPRFTNMVQNCVELLEKVREQICSKITSSPEYMKMVEHLSKALHEIELLRREDDKLKQVQRPDVQMSNSSAPCVAEEVPIVQAPVSNNQLRKEIKGLFQIIWNQVQSFCLRVNELVSNYGIADPEVVDQLKCQFPQVMQKLQELIGSIEKIISMEPQEIAQSKQLVVDFANFLIGLNVIQTDSLNFGTFMENIEFFCCDEESRAILCVLINDLKQFGTQIVDGMKHLGFI